MAVDDKGKQILLLHWNWENNTYDLQISGNGKRIVRTPDVKQAERIALEFLKVQEDED